MQTLIKNTRAYKLLKAETAKNRLAHAYLVLLDDSRNLRAALKTFAKILFGVDEPLSPAQKRIADLIETESFSDCLFFPAPDKKFMVEDAEKIAEESALKAVEGEKKVFVVGDFAEATLAAQNKLLKLLEEPPKGVIFLLGATSVFPVLPTVLSRTKRLEIQAFSTEDVEACLARLYGDKHDQKTLSVCAACSDGNVGQAQTMLEGGHYKELLESAFSLCLTPISKLPSAVKSIGETKYKKELLSLLRLIFRDALLLKTQGAKAEKHLLLKSEKERVFLLVNAYTPPALLYAQTAISEAERQGTFNAVFPQCIEICIAKIREKNK